MNPGTGGGVGGWGGVDDRAMLRGQVVSGRCSLAPVVHMGKEEARNWFIPLFQTRGGQWRGRRSHLSKVDSVVGGGFV